MGVNRYSFILDLQFKPIIGDLQSCPTVFAMYGTVLKPNARSGSARDGHGRGQRSFDPVHDQGPLPGLTANRQSRPETAIALSVKPPFNVGGQGQPQAVAPGPTGKRSSLKPFEIKRD